ncbi:MAG: response regulator [bacterium]|nr:response regulator [bacterium]
MKKTVLIADDEADIVETLQFMLESDGFEVLTAYDGEEALNLARRAIPDIILLDVMMPKINGYKVSRLLKFDKKFQDIPILMITARSQEEDKLIGEETGADEYITKPFDISNVIDLINKHLQV